jgi:hypothetical protein
MSILRQGPSGPEAVGVPSFGLLTEAVAVGEVGGLAYKEITIIDPRLAALTEGQVIQALFAPAPNDNLIIAYAAVGESEAEIRITVYNGFADSENFGNQRFLVLGYPVVVP